MKKRSKSLILKRETLRELSKSEERQIVAGIVGTLTRDDDFDGSFICTTCIQSVGC